MKNALWFAAAALLILLTFFLSSLRERRRIRKQIEEEFLGASDPGPLQGPYPTFRSVKVLLLGIAGLFPLAGLPFAAAAIALAPGAASEARGKPLLLPSLRLTRAAVFFSILGLAASAICAANLLSSPPDFRVTPLIGENRALPENPSVSPSTVILAVIMLVLAAVTHEVAHGLAAYWSGDDTAKKAGRLTLNPIPHIDPLGSLVVPLALVLLKTGFVIGWARPVPVRVDKFRDRRLGQAAVSVAGVAVNMTNMMALFAVFAAFGSIVRMAVPGGIENYTAVTGEAALGGVLLHPLALAAQGLKMGILVNLGLALFNLLPLPPLDGANLLESFLSPRFASFFETARAVGCVMLPVLILVAMCLMIPILIPAAMLLMHVFGAFLTRM